MRRRPDRDEQPTLTFRPVSCQRGVCPKEPSPSDLRLADVSRSCSDRPVCCDAAVSSLDAIGGFFELELRRGTFPNSHSHLLGSGRNCLEFIIRSHNFTRVFLPKYVCDAVMEPVGRLGLSHTFYAIDEHFELTEEINPEQGEVLLYTNYFGLKDDYCRRLASELGSRLILDCCQALFFDAPHRSHTFYSPRKFVGVPDGGCVITDRPLDPNTPIAYSLARFQHLAKRIEVGPEAAYRDFLASERSLANRPIERMSSLTRALLANIDYGGVYASRRANYAVLEELLGRTNQSCVQLHDHSCPLFYPYLSDVPTLRDALTAARIFVPMLWPNVLRWTCAGELEFHLAKELLLLPIDQRYSAADMRRIVNVINAS
jgi:hypothetical protein